ncbi:Histidine-containing phosphotransfer protein 1 [Linum perenne]
MEVVQMQRTWVKYTRSLFTEAFYVWGMGEKGFLDSQFAQLQLLQDESNPDFVVEVVSLFFEDSDRLLDDLTKALDPQQGVDFKKVDAHVHQLKGSSSSIGAQRVKNACVAFRSFCDEQNIEGSLRCLQQVKQEYYLVKNKLENLIRLEQQIVAAGGSIPMEELGFQ